MLRLSVEEKSTAQLYAGGNFTLILGSLTLLKILSWLKRRTAITTTAITTLFFNFVLCQKYKFNVRLYLYPFLLNIVIGLRGRDRRVVGFREFEFRSKRGVLDTTLCDKACH